MTAHECLLHPWLTGDHSAMKQEINRDRYLAYREKLRRKYEDFERFCCRLAGFLNTHP